MRNVYDPDDFDYRVNFAARVISTGAGSSRKFDTCFEMGDGDAVVVALYRRSLNNPRLAAKLWSYVTRATVMPVVARLFTVSTKDLKLEAARQRKEKHQ